VSHTAKRQQLTWVLAAVLLLLLLGIAYELKQSSTTTAPIRRVEDITKITIERQGAATIELELHDSWRITAPIQMQANDQRIVPLLTVYTNPDPGYALSDVDLAATGLDKPKATLSFNGYVIDIGNVAIDGGRSHARHGERVSFVPDWVLSLVNGGISAFADLTVWGESLQSIKLDDGTELDSVALVEARSLSAQQLVLWPRDDAPATLSVHQVQATTTIEEQNWTITVTERYTALQAEHSAYAYIATSNDISWLPQP